MPNNNSGKNNTLLRSTAELVSGHGMVRTHQKTKTLICFAIEIINQESIKRIAMKKLFLQQTYWTLFLSFVFSCLLNFIAPTFSVAQTWKDWDTLPVFHDGRVMPNSSFARQIVKEITGSTMPYLVPDDTVLAELNRVAESKPRASQQESNDYQFLIRRDNGLQNLDLQSSNFNDSSDGKKNEVDLAISHLTSAQAAQILRRIQAFLPGTGRFVTANELLLSWITEPEIWEFIPIFYVPEYDYRTEILDIPYQNLSRTRLRRVSPFQLQNSSGFQQRLISMERKQESSSESPSEFDQITNRIMQEYQTFQELIFDPHSDLPTRMIDILRQSVDYEDNPSASATNGFRTWGHLLNLAETSLDRINQETENHPTTKRWHAISRKIIQLATAFDKINPNETKATPNLEAVERQFDLLLDAIDVNLEESAAMMEKIYPELSLQKAGQKIDATTILPGLFSQQNISDPQTLTRLKQAVLMYYHSLKILKYEVEMAFLSLYDNGRTLRVMPLRIESSLNQNERTVDMSPWLSLQVIRHGGERAIRRFLYPAYQSSDAKKMDASSMDANSIDVNSTLQNSKTQITSDSQDKTIPELNLIIDINSDNLVDSSENAPEKNEMEASSENGQTDSGMFSETKSNSEKVVQSGISDSANMASSSDQQESASDDMYEIDLFTPETKKSANEVGTTFSMKSRIQGGDPIDRIRAALEALHMAYLAVDTNRGYADFRGAASDFANTIRDLNKLSESNFQQRNKIESELADSIAKRTSTSTNTDAKSQNDISKTDYPAAGSLNMEYIYFRYKPFLWMWIFSALSIVCVGCSVIFGVVRHASIEATKQAGIDSTLRDPKYTSNSNFTSSPEEYAFWTGIVFLVLATLVTFIGGMMRAWISGWAPVTNMYETIVLLAFFASLFGLWYSLTPLLKPATSLAWSYSSFPSVSKFLSLFSQTKQDESESLDRVTFPKRELDAALFRGDFEASDKISAPSQKMWSMTQIQLIWQSVFVLPRIILMLLTFFAVIHLSYYEYAKTHSVFETAMQMLQIQDMIDLMVVILSIGLIVWFVPHFILTAILSIIFLARPSHIAAELGIMPVRQELQLNVPTNRPERSEMNSIFRGESGSDSSQTMFSSGFIWLNQARNQILERKIFLLVAAFIVLFAGLAAEFNSTQFNPNIRPLVAVLRSNFWLTIHVITIILGYATAMLAWGLAAFALGFAIFARYRHIQSPTGKHLALLPLFCDQVAPTIHKLLQFALLFLILGTVLGGRWADYSWGRFWGWDPKEVWALIAILFYSIVLHGRIVRFYGHIGLLVGALLGGIVIVMTWYGINFVMKGSVHSYGGGGAGPAMIFLVTCVVINLLWALIALFRYSTEVYGVEA
ncbi:MAG: cytochrome c biogenesis protein CcsA [Thermoguttaceae bacterium]